MERWREMRFALSTGHQWLLPSLALHLDICLIIGWAQYMLFLWEPSEQLIFVCYLLQKGELDESEEVRTPARSSSWADGLPPIIHSLGVFPKLLETSTRCASSKKTIFSWWHKGEGQPWLGMRSSQGSHSKLRLKGVLRLSSNETSL